MLELLCNNFKFENFKLKIVLYNQTSNNIESIYI